MASSEIVKRAIAGGRTYEELPPRVKNMLSPGEWKTKVKEYCIQRGLPWATSLACTVMGQQEYYDELLRCYKAWMRLFPYHLSDYLCRVARLTPFKYYLDLMTSVLKEERSYDRVPNFTAADALAVLGIGRNEYIAALNACKARRLMWRVNLNREGIAREQLPQEPSISSRLEPWWRVAVVNIGEAEYRELDEEELAHLKTAALPVAAAGGNIRVRDFQLDVLRGLLRRGLAYVEVPVEPHDRFAIPPLEGFVSNKTTDAGDAAADPLESLLYSVFVANSERMTVSELAAILGVELEELKAAIGVASRLGFATRVTDLHLPPSPGVPVGGLLDGDAGGGGGLLYDGSTGLVGNDGDEASPAAAAAMAAQRQAQQQQQTRSLQLAEGQLAPQGSVRAGFGGGGGGGGVAVVVDAEATGYLMMGALSPGLKRHSVTLFEGGRVAGEEVMQELVSELWASYAAGQGFEGEMLSLTNYAAALATLLEAVRASAGPGVPLELLRKESLAGLAPLAACKVLHAAYCAVVPISPLPPPVLPLSPMQPGPGPAYFGPSLEAVSPWLHLALYAAARSGPVSYVFVCGQRVWRLPHPLDRCTHALLTPWDEDAEAGKGGRAHGSEGTMMIVESSFLLYTLNELLSRTAVLAQPLDCTEFGWSPDVVDVPLPLPPPPVVPACSVGTTPTSSTTPIVVPGVRRTGGEPICVALEPGLVLGLKQLGLASCVGHLRLMRMRGPKPQPHPPAPPPPPPAGPASGAADAWQGNHHNHQQQQQQRPGNAAAAGSGVGFPFGSSFTITAVSQSRAAVAATARDAPLASSSSSFSQASGAVGSGGPATQSLPADALASPRTLAAPSSSSSLSTRQPPAGAGGGGGLDPAAATAAAASDGVEPWLPHSVQLGVPLYALDLCRAVCRAAAAAGFLTHEGRQTQLQAQKLLHSQLTKLLVQYSHCTLDGSYGSASAPAVAAAVAAPPSGGGVSACEAAPASTSDLGAAPPSGGDFGGGPGAVQPPGGLGRLNPVLPLPALNLSFDGRSLQPIRLRDSMQGLGCLCQG